MTPLRKRFIEDLKLHSLSNPTQRTYISAVRRLAALYHRTPDQITQEELRQYFLYLTGECKRSPSSIRGTLCGLKFFYEKTLQRFPAVAGARAEDERTRVFMTATEENWPRELGRDLQRWEVKAGAVQRRV
jgi:site-specific recombinase XerD